MDSTYPDYFARFYDLIYSNILTGQDTGYYLRKAREVKGAVLEAGSGTGRFFTEALKEGIDIYGIDISPAMIRILKNRVPPEEHHRVSVQNIIDFQAGRKFNLIIAPFRVFMHLETIGDQLRALDHIYDQLFTCGQFIFDVFVPNPHYLAHGVTEMVDFDGEYEPGEKLKRTVSASYDLVNQTIRLTMKFEWTEKGLLHSGTWNSTMRLFFRYELEHLMRQSRFHQFSIFGDFNETPLSDESKEFVIVCTK